MINVLIGLINVLIGMIHVCVGMISVCIGMISVLIEMINVLIGMINVLIVLIVMIDLLCLLVQADIHNTIYLTHLVRASERITHCPSLERQAYSGPLDGSTTAVQGDPQLHSTRIAN